MKYYMLATGAILFYDYLLTLADEIKYFWSGKKQWTFWLFLFNRYFPMTYQLWQLAVSYSPHFDQKVCDKTVWYSILTFVVCTLLAQTVLTLRIYAVTLGSVPVTIVLGVITVGQFLLGIYVTISGAEAGAQPLPQVPLDPYHLCLFVELRTHYVGYASISLCYDLLAFSLIVYLVIKSKSRGSKLPSLFKIIVKDATRYFLVIFTSHFFIPMALIFVRESIRLLPALGLLAYLPVMVSRIMLSLRKLADPQRVDWSLVDPVGNGPSLKSMRFVNHQRSTNGGQDGTQPDMYLS